MSLGERILALVKEAGGRVPAERLVREVLGMPAARGDLAVKLASSALREVRGLRVEGQDVVVGAPAPLSGQLAVLALAPSRSATALPPLLVWARLGQDPRPEEVALPTDGEAWREGLVELARNLAGATVLALSARSARRVLRLASLLARLEPDEEPLVVALGPVARAAGQPIRTAADAAAIVGEAAPDTPYRAALLLARLVPVLAESAGVAAPELAELARRELAVDFEWGDRAFARADVVGLPEAPGVYLFENEAGDVVYVGKAADLRRRVASYFRPAVEPRDERIREAAHALSHQRTGSELSALLREHELIRDLRPALNVQEEVHPSRARETPLPGGPERIAVVQPSAEGGAEVVLIDRARGVSTVTVVPEEERAARDALLSALDELTARSSIGGPADPAAELALRWLAARGDAATVVDATSGAVETADLLARLAGDPDLGRERIVPV